MKPEYSAQTCSMPQLLILATPGAAQVISSLDCADWMSPCLLTGRVPSTCVITMLRNDGKGKLIFNIFFIWNSAWWVRRYSSKTFCDLIPAWTVLCKSAGQCLHDIINLGFCGKDKSKPFHWLMSRPPGTWPEPRHSPCPTRLLVRSFRLFLSQAEAVYRCCTAYSGKKIYH